MSEIERHSVVITLDDSDYEKGMDSAERKFESFKSKSGSLAKGVGGIATGAIAGLGAALVGAGAAGTKMADDLEGALNGLQASTGSNDEEMKNMEESLKNIYNSNYGDSFQDIADSMANVKQTTNLSGQELEKMTERALMLRDTFGNEVNETTQTADTLMKNFGITGDEAMTLIAQGAQNGADKNGDMLEVLNEYAPQFKAVGFGAEDMMNTLISGAESGAFSMDKVGDAVKEMNIRMKDGNKETSQALTDLGFDAQKLQSDFAKGGEAGKKAFQKVVSKLSEMPNGLEKNRVGVALMGTQYEDLESGAVDALANMSNKADKNAKTLQKIDEIKYNSFGEALKGIGRNLTTSLIEPLQKHILPLLNDFSKFIIKNMPQIKKTISKTFDIIGKVIGTAVDTVKNIISVFKESDETSNSSFTNMKETISDILITIGGIVKEFVTFVQDIWDKYGKDMVSFWKKAMNNMLDIIDGVLETIRGVVKTVLSLIKGDWEGAFDGIKMIVRGVFNTLKGVVKTGVNGIKGILSGAWTVIKNVASAAWDGIKSAITNPIESAKTKIDGIIDKIKNVFSNLKLSIPKPKIPHIDVDWRKFGVGNMSVKVPDFDISWYKTGGIFNQPSIAGLAEAGSEAILPLENKQMFAPFAKAISDNMRQKDFASHRKAVVTVEGEDQPFTYNLSFNIDKVVGSDRKTGQEFANYAFEAMEEKFRDFGK